VRKIEALHGMTVVYNLEVVPYASFFAEGLVVEDYAGEEQVEAGSDLGPLSGCAVRTMTDPRCAQRTLRTLHEAG
jgi:hypothetical protein